MVRVLRCSSLLPLRSAFLPFPLQGFLLLTGPFAPRGCQTSPSTCCPLQPEGTGFCISRTRWLLFRGELPMESALSLVLLLCPDDDDDDFYFLFFLFLLLLSCGRFFSPPFPSLDFPTEVRWLYNLQWLLTELHISPSLMRAFCSCMKSPPS